MKARLARILKNWILPALFWLLLWQILCMIVGQKLLLPPPVDVFRRLEIAGRPEFWAALGMSLLRAAAAYVLGVVLAFLLAALCQASRIATRVIKPAMAFIRATPVAAFIMLALVWLSAARAPVLAGLLMVMPVVFANTLGAMVNTPRKYLEFAECYRFGRWKRFRHVLVPSSVPGFLTACHACVGLCLKATVAAEVIGLPENAVGTELYYSKTYLETDTLLAWTLALVIMSLLAERLLKALLERGLRGVHHAE